MKAPQGPWHIVDEATSTQDLAANLLLSSECPEVVLAHHQSKGRGRFQRKWDSAPGDSLTYSLIFTQYAGHKRPWLIGMSVAIAVAKAVEGSLQWPNDVVIGMRKVAGILTELLPDDSGKNIPVVGVGVNLNQAEMPRELADRATSLLIETGSKHDVLNLAHDIVEQLRRLPDPDDWNSIEPYWRSLDQTMGKRYRLSDGVDSVAVGITEEGALICNVDGVEKIVMAAEAILPS